MKTTGWMRWAAGCGIALLGAFLGTGPLPAADAKSPPLYNAEIRLLGAVHHPGWYPIAADSTVSEVLKRAGGLTADASDVMAVIRKGQGKGFIVSLHDPSFHLQPDDELRVLWTQLQ
jgi:hypothetical protein